ncbi:hypothetical protein G7046_g7374 [Stylonectria norvegica]|nr:hypothetical protein G7046_g7374 [Stylonectria norvegica]
MDDDNDDPRLVELETLEAIYPEIQRLDERSPFSFQIDLPVEPTDPVTVTFPPREIVEGGLPAVDVLQVTHLPSLRLRIHLPDGYPGNVPPKVEITTTPLWLDPEIIRRLEDEGPRLWDEVGRDTVVYSYLDHVQHAAEDVFGALTPEGTLQVDAVHQVGLLDYDNKAKKAAFEKETFDCGVCLDPKKGSQCHKMLDCGHIFCLECLRGFYGDAIKEGNLAAVRCLTPNCAKERAAAQKSAIHEAGGPTTRSRKPKITVSPSELLQIGLPEDVVERYVTLKYKTELESDKDTIYCPRQWCNGAARSKKHKKPLGLEFAETSDDDEQEAPASTPTGHHAKFNPADLLSVCEDCGFAFCSRCAQSWHGEFVRCAPPRETGELTEEEKASLEYVKLHTSPCPTCNAPAQKTHGCNHMICSRCDSHFCYLCSAWLDPTNPYRHYNAQPGGKVTSCHNRLWELEQGDGDDVGLGFHGGRGGALVQDGVDLDRPLDGQQQRRWW